MKLVETVDGVSGRTEFRGEKKEKARAETARVKTGL